MTTQTSTTRKWLSICLLIPIVGILFYSFAKKEYVEKDYSEISETLNNKLEAINDYNLEYLEGRNNQEYANFLGVWHNEAENISFQIHTNNGGLLWDVRYANEPYTRYYPKKTSKGWSFTYNNSNLEFEFSDEKIKDSRGFTFKKISNQSTSKNFKIILDEAGDILINNKKETLASLTKRVAYIKSDLSLSEINKLIKITIFNKSKQNEARLQKIENLLTAKGFNDLQVVNFYKSETEKSELGNFLVTVEKNGNTLELRCEEGCRWSHLVLEPNAEPYIINDFGFSKGKTLDIDKFAFSIAPNNNGVALSGIKGTAWVDLAFSLRKNKRQAVNPLGMITLPLNLKKEHSKKVLTMSAVGDQLFIDGKASSLNTYIKDLDAITKNWSSDDFEQTKLDLKTENCSKDFLETLNELHKKTDHFLITVLGIENPSAVDKAKVKIQQTNTSTGFREADGKLLYYTNINGKLTYYNRNGVITDKNGKEISPGKQESDYDILPGSKVTKVYKDDIVVVEFKDRRSINQDSTGVTVKQFAAYNKWAKALNEKPLGERIIKLKDFEYYESIYNLMTPEQKLSAQPLPIAPPPPPPAPLKEPNHSYFKYSIFDVYINIKGELLLDDEVGNLKTFEKKLKALNASNEPNRLIYLMADEASPRDIIDELKTIAKTYGFKLNQINIPPPPPPSSTLPPSLDNAKNELLVNGKAFGNEPIIMTRDELKRIELSTVNGKIKNFKLKIPKQRTQFIKGNSTKSLGDTLLKTISKGQDIVIFDAKDGSGIKIKPLILSITD